MPICFIGLGSNLGSRRKNITLAIERINQLKGTRVIKISSIIESLPQGGPPQGKFLNSVIKINTKLSPRSLLNFLQDIESRLGRVRTVKNAPRTIDLDILLYANKKIRQKGLIVPHPRMKKRDFVLMPLREIAPGILKSINADRKNS